MSTFDWGTVMFSFSCVCISGYIQCMVTIAASKTSLKRAPPANYTITYTSSSMFGLCCAGKIAYLVGHGMILANLVGTAWHRPSIKWLLWWCICVSISTEIVCRSASGRPWSRRMSYHYVVLLRQIKLSRLSVFNSFGPLGVIGDWFQPPLTPRNAAPTQAHSQYDCYIFFRQSTNRHTCKASNLLDNRLDVCGCGGMGWDLLSGFCVCNLSVAGSAATSFREGNDTARIRTNYKLFVVLYRFDFINMN